ncbi:MAG: ammonium transporter [Candidatus Saccharibacteria bacterium]|nr:ammonium transporter [Rhodoferax sp.]
MRTPSSSAMRKNALAAIVLSMLTGPLIAQTTVPSAAVPAATLPMSMAPVTNTVVAAAQAAGPAFSGGDTAWMLVCTVLVMLMTIPGIMLFYSGMMRAKNALSVVAHVFAATAVVTLVWAAVGYSLAFTVGNPWIGDMSRLWSEGLIGAAVKAHPSAPTVPESAFFLFQLAFAIISFALVIGATVERMRLSATIFFAGLWTILVYAPIAHWIWEPSGWLSAMGHMDFAGGTVVHIAAGASGLVAAKVIGPRAGFGTQPMVPHNLLITVLGAGLLWAGWFGFNAGSAFEASSRAVGALLATQVAACVGAFVWGMCEYTQRGKFGVLGMATGAIAGLIAVTPASGYVGVLGASVIGFAAAIGCYLAVTRFKSWTNIDDSLDVFALHWVGGFIGTVLTPVMALKAIAPITSTFMTNLTGALAVSLYAGGMTYVVLMIVKPIAGLRVTAKEEEIGLDLAQHGEMIGHP